MLRHQPSVSPASLAHLQPYILSPVLEDQSSRYEFPCFSLYPVPAPSTTILLKILYVLTVSFHRRKVQAAELVNSETSTEPGIKTSPLFLSLSPFLSCFKIFFSSPFSVSYKHRYFGKSSYTLIRSCLLIVTKSCRNLL